MEKDFLWLSNVKVVSRDDVSDKSFLYVGDRLVARLSKQLGEILVAARAQLPKVNPHDLTREIVGMTGEEISQALEAIEDIPAIRRIKSEKQGLFTGFLQFRRPFSVQLTLLNPERLLKQLPWILTILRAPIFWWFTIALNIVAMFLTSIAFLDGESPLYGPIPMWGYLGVFGGFFITVFFHELAHAATLVAFGGKSKRAGFMLFYLTPAFFCDVSDSWMLPRRQRVQVALAGILTQGSIAAFALVTAPFFGKSMGNIMVVFGCLSMLYGLLNLLPFIKLDGYIVLAGAYDEPHLREHCMDEAKRSVVAIFTRDRSVIRDDTSPIRVVFGFLCMIFPLAVIAGAIVAFRAYLNPLGRIAPWIMLSIVAALAGWGVFRCATNYRWLRNSLRKSRLAATSLTLAGIFVVAGLSFIPLPARVSGGYAIMPDGPVFISSDRTQNMPQGAVIFISAPGIINGETVGKFSVAGSGKPCTAPLKSMAAVTDESNLTVEAWCYPIRSEEPADPPDIGLATADLGTRTAAGRVTDLVRGLFP